MDAADALARQEIERFEELARRALPRFGIAGAPRLECLRLGENAVFGVTDEASGGRWALRVHRPDYHGEPAIRSELAWLSALRSEGFPCPEPVAGVDGDPLQRARSDGLPEDRFCALFRWIEGRPAIEEKDGLAIFAKLGELCGRLHEHVRRWQPPPGFERRAWDLEAMIGERPVLGRVEDTGGFSPEERAVLLAARERARERLRAFGCAPDRFGLVHADLNVTNLLVGGETAHLLDFDDCGYGWFVYDLATAVTLYEESEDYARLLAAWLEGYGRFASLPDEQWAMLPTLIVARRLLLVGWLATHGDTPVAREFGPELRGRGLALSRRYLENGLVELAPPPARARRAAGGTPRGETAAEPAPRTNAAALDLVARHLSPHKVRAYRERYGVDWAQGDRDGIRIRDVEGRSWINCRSSGGVFNFGHRPRFVVEALKAALDEHDMGDWFLPSARRARGAAALAEIYPGELRYTQFTASGAEAAECACKLARGVTKRTGFVSIERGYHGHVGFSLAMDDERLSRWYGPFVPGIRRVPFGDLAALERAVGDGTAAVCMETIPATAGMLIPADGYLQGVRRLCDERGALLLLDEVQAGLGRTGRFFACEHWGVAPDLLMFGKGSSGGLYPIAGVGFGERVQEHFREDPLLHPSSFGGSELGAVVVETVVGKLREPGFLAHVSAMGARFREGFEGLRSRHPDTVTGYRQLGLMMALETRGEGQGVALMRSAIRNGLLAVASHNRPSALQVMPPLVISPEEVDEVIERLDRALAEMQD